MTKGRFFRALICFLVIGCLMFSYITLPSRAAFFIDDAAITVTALGLTVLFFIMATGFIPPPDITISNVNQLDQSFRNWYGDLDLSFRNPDDPWPDDLDDEESKLSEQMDAIKDAINNGAEEDLNQTLKISEDLLSALKLFAAFCIGENALALPGEEAPEGYAYYNGVLLPEFPDVANKPYVYLLRTNENYAKYGDYMMMASSMPVTYYYRSDYPELSYPRLNGEAGAWYVYGYQVTDSGSYSGVYNNSRGSGSASLACNYGGDIIWANHDIIHESNGSVWFPSSEPLTQEEAYLEAAAILGETAQGIQDGTKTSDDIVVPGYVNVSEFFADASSLDDVMQNYNQISQELQDGTRNYDDFVQSITATNPGTGDNENTGDDIIGGDNITGTDPWTPPDDPGNFALDLSKVFPFCIPFDLYAFLACLNAEPVAPVIQWELALPGGGSYPMEIDLSPFESVAQVLRRLQLLLFIVGLAIKTRDLIKG